MVKLNKERTIPLRFSMDCQIGNKKTPGKSEEEILKFSAMDLVGPLFTTSMIVFAGVFVLGSYLGTKNQNIFNAVQGRRIDALESFVSSFRPRRGRRKR